MTPDELRQAVETLITATSAEPVMVEVNGLLYELDRVEADTAGQLTLRVKRVPDAAVQIADDAFPEDFTYPCDLPRDVVVALARAGWLHDPAEVVALRAVADAARVAREEGYPVHPDARKALAALDALPPADGAR